MMAEIDTLKLETYARLDGTETGEMLMHLLALHGYGPYLSSEFAHALEVEISKNLAWFDANTVIVERTEEITRSYRELQYSPERRELSQDDLRWANEVIEELDNLEGND